MKRVYDIEVATDVLCIRLGQMIINEMYKNGVFKIPIHLALGHEAIAVAVSGIMREEDLLVLSHRNVHYNLAQAESLRPEIDEYLLREDGLAKGQLGSMNLANEKKGIIYTSSILGNNLGVAAGLALGQKVKRSKGVVIVVTGDGAMEEGSFSESLLFLKSNNLSSIIIIENNGWSLATTISQRRYEINLENYMSAFGAKYERLESNDVYEYIEKLEQLREYALKHKTPVCVEVELTTLGYWWMKTDEYPDGKFINYHAGPSPSVNLTECGVIDNSEKDPVFVLKRHFDENTLKEMSVAVLKHLREDIKGIKVNGLTRGHLR